jgi:competence protein ComEC
LKSDVLVVGHHGSRTSSRIAFLDAVGAQHFIISSGPTKYGTVVLPDEDVLTELTRSGQVFRTDRDDVGCASASAKIGPDNDGKPGGCDNIVVILPPGGEITAEYSGVAD